MKTNKNYEKLAQKNQQLQARLDALSGMKGIKEKLYEQIRLNAEAKKHNYPISSSNIFQIKKYLESWLEAGKNDVINLRLQMMWSKIRYFQNLLKFENDKFLQFYGHRLSQAMLFYGACAVAEFPRGGDSELRNKVIIPISPIVSDINGNIVQAKTFCAPFFGGLAEKTAYDKLIFDNKVITENGIQGNSDINKAVFFKWESIGLTYMWMLLPFIDILIKIINMLQINIGAGMHKYLYQFEGAFSEDLINEIKQLSSPYSNVVLLHKDPSMGASRKNISTIAGDNKTPPNIFTQQDLAHFMNLMAYFTAEFTNLSEKTSERNINAEVTVNASFFSISQQEFLREAQLAIEFYNEIFKASATVGFTYDVQKETGNESEKDVDYQTKNGAINKPK